MISHQFYSWHARSGTTLVEQIISSHSQVTGAGELNYVAKYGGELAINSTSTGTEGLFEFRKYLLELSKLSNGKPFVVINAPEFLFYTIDLLLSLKLKLFICNAMPLLLVGQTTSSTLHQMALLLRFKGCSDLL